MTPLETPANPVISLTQNLEVTVPAAGRCFVMPDTEWANLRKRVEKIQHPKTFFQTVSSVAFGIAGSALITALTLADQVKEQQAQARELCFGLAILFAVIGGLSLVYHSMQKDLLVCSREDVLDEMTRIKDQYQPGGHS